MISSKFDNHVKLFTQDFRIFCDLNLVVMVFIKLQKILVDLHLQSVKFFATMKPELKT